MSVILKTLFGKIIEEVVETAAEEAFKRLHQYLSENGLAESVPTPEQERGVDNVAESGGKND